VFGWRGVWFILCYSDAFAAISIYLNLPSFLAARQKVLEGGPGETSFKRFPPDCLQI